MLQTSTAAQAAPAGARPAAPPRLMPLRLSDRLAEPLGDQIDSGALRPGGHLPTEAQLALAHGVSRTFVRGAVHQLKSRERVVSRQGSGVFVSPPPLHQPLAFDPTVLGSLQAVVHVVELRRVIEAEMTALAAERATRAQIAAMRRSLRAIDAAAAGQDGVAEDLAFHRAIGEATGNPQFTLLVGFLQQYLRESMRITRGNEARRIDFMQAVRLEHRAIFDAIPARDPLLARRRARKHMAHSEARLVAGGVIPKPAPAAKRSRGR